MSEISDVDLETAAKRCLEQIEATKALYTILIELKNNDKHSWTYGDQYTKAEREELNAFRRRHLLRRMREEARKCGFHFTDVVGRPLKALESGDDA